MTIIRREHRAHFTVLPNAIFVDQRLSIEAKGVLGYLLSRPNKWSVRLEQVGRTLKVGRRRLQRIFRELISAGYVTRDQRRIGSVQRYGQVDYVVRDVPVMIARPVDNSVKPRVQNGPAARLAQAIAALRNQNCGRGSKTDPHIKNGRRKKHTNQSPQPAPMGGMAGQRKQVDRQSTRMTTTRGAIPKLSRCSEIQQKAGSS